VVGSERLIAAGVAATATMRMIGRFEPAFVAADGAAESAAVIALDRITGIILVLGNALVKNLHSSISPC